MLKPLLLVIETYHKNGRTVKNIFMCKYFLRLVQILKKLLISSKQRSLAKVDDVLTTLSL